MTAPVPHTRRFEVRPVATCRFIRPPVLVVLLLLVAASAQADEWVHLRIPLEAGRYYTLHDVYRQCNEHLGADYDLQRIDDRRLELTPPARAALLLADQLELVRVTLDEQALILAVPDTQNDLSRQRHRQRLERLLNVPLQQWPAHLGLSQPVDIDAGRPTILFVHGMEAGRGSWVKFEAACQSWGIQTLTFNYPNDGPPARAGERLAMELRQLAQQHPELRLVIVGHSMGGLVARHALEVTGLPPGLISDLFTLGTPHHGSTLAGAQDWLELIQTSIPQALRPTASLQSGLGEAAVDLQPGSRFLKTLNAAEPPATVRYHVGIGTRGFLPDAAREPLRQAVRDALARRGVHEQVRRRLLRLLDADELWEGSGDGAVTMQSARLPGATSERTFERNHLELILLAGEEPSDDAVFRWIVDTMQWPREATP